MKQKILIADDHQMFLDGLKLIFSNHPIYNIIAEARSGEEVLNSFKQHIFDFAILDVNMPKPNGFEVCKILRKQYPDCKLIILSMYNDENFIKEFLNSGASAYILKNAGKAELLNALEIAQNGGKFISKELNHINTIEFKDDFAKSYLLTKREVEIIKLLANEKSTNQIAEELFISAYTVSTHRKNILQKLNIKNTAGIVKFAADNGIL